MISLPGASLSSGGAPYTPINRASIINIELLKSFNTRLVRASGIKALFERRNYQGLIRKLAASKSESPQQRIMRYAREEDYNGAGIDFGRSDYMGQMGAIP